jgi:hypothetical protein
MRIIQTVSITQEQALAIKEHGLSPSEIFRAGLGITLAEAGVRDYDSNLNLYRKMIAFKSIVEDLSNKLNALTEKR